MIVGSKSASTENSQWFASTRSLKYAEGSYWNERFLSMLTEKKRAVRTELPRLRKSTLKRAPAVQVRKKMTFEEFYGRSFDYKVIAPVLRHFLVNYAASILHVGCGLSRLGIKMKKDGYSGIINVDISPIAIQAMQQSNPDHRFAVMDIWDLILPSSSSSSSSPSSSSLFSLSSSSSSSSCVATRTDISTPSICTRPSMGASITTEAANTDGGDDLFSQTRLKAGSVQAIIEKGLLDAVLCGPGSKKRFKNALKQYHQALEVGGFFICLCSVGSTKNYLDRLCGSPSQLSQGNPRGKLVPLFYTGGPTRTKNSKIYGRAVKRFRQSNLSMNRRISESDGNQSHAQPSTRADPTSATRKRDWKLVARLSAEQLSQTGQTHSGRKRRTRHQSHGGTNEQDRGALIPSNLISSDRAKKMLYVLQKC